MNRGRGFAASHQQRRKVAGAQCLACGASPCDPAHLTPRSMGGCDDRLCVIPLCRRCHDDFDDHELDLLPVDRRMIPEIQHALAHHGLSWLVTRLTGCEWQSVGKVAA